MSDQAIASRFIHATLSADSTLVALVPNGFHPRIAPPGTLPPYIVYQNMSAVDWQGATAAVYMGSSQLWAVYAIVAGRSEGGVAETIADRIHSLLYRVVPTAISGGTVIGCHREGTPPTTYDAPNGVDYTRVGVGIYRIITQDATMAALADLT